MSEHADDVRAVRGDWLLALIRATCAAGRTSPEDMAEVLNLTIQPGYRSYAEVDPLPEGVIELLFGLDEDNGPVRYVSVALADQSLIALADIETGLADGREMPPQHPGDPDRLIYDLASGSRRCRISIDLRPADPGASGRRRLVAAVTVLP